MSKSKILMIATGSISVYKTLDLISRLKKENYPVKVVLTASAGKFVTPLTFASLCEGQVYCELFDSKDPMGHIELARWADKIIVAPATANFINKLASGIADDLASCLFLAHTFDKPFIIYPAMNQAMLNHAITKESIAKLSRIGVTIGETDMGVLACGEVGYGKLLDTDIIFQEITQKISNKIKVLITSGGTQEPIDEVRYIGNMSTGKTGKILGETLSKEGFEVTTLHAENALIATAGKKISFKTYDDLAKKLVETLNTHHFDYIIHLAAVSDFSVDKITNSNGEIVDSAGKISSKEKYQIHLKENEKIIKNLGQYSPGSKIIGFKLTHTSDSEKQRKAIEKIFANPGVEFVVHNDLQNIKKHQHHFTLYSKHDRSIQIENALELGSVLAELMSELNQEVNEVRI